MGGAWGALSGELSFYVREGRWRIAAAVLAGHLRALCRHRAQPAPLLQQPDHLRVRPVLRVLLRHPLRHGGRGDGAAPLRIGSGSALTLVAASILAAHLVKGPEGRPELRNLHRPGVALFGAVCATASLMLVLEGWRLGHWETASTITRELGAQVNGARCDVVYPRSMREEQARLFAKDCDQELKAVERYFEVEST